MKSVPLHSVLLCTWTSSRPGSVTFLLLAGGRQLVVQVVLAGAGERHRLTELLLAWAWSPVEGEGGSSMVKGAAAAASLDTWPLPPLPPSLPRSSQRPPGLWCGRVQPSQASDDGI